MHIFLATGHVGIAIARIIQRLDSMTLFLQDVLESKFPFRLN